MDKVQARALLTLVSTLDQRKISEDVVEAWAAMLKDVAPVYATEAVEEHFRQKPDVYLNVGHVVAGAKRAKLKADEQLVSEARQLEEADWVSEPQPICEDHNLRILECLDCCSLIFAQADYMRVDDRHSWAMTHVYKAKEAW